jgi:two-component system, LuxR family, response regulator FixJ
MSTTTLTVFVVDDDEALCEALAGLLRSHGLSVQTAHSAEEFLSIYTPDAAGCLVADVRLGGMSGLELQTRLAERAVPLPTILISGHGDIPMAVHAVQLGAVDFLEKPVDDRVLVARVRAALQRAEQQRDDLQRRSDTLIRLQGLTPRERQILSAVVVGQPNKQIAAKFGISEKTVEVHRKRVLHKMGVHNAASLTHLVLAAEAAGPVPRADEIANVRRPRPPAAKADGAL